MKSYYLLPLLCVALSSCSEKQEEFVSEKNGVYFVVDEFISPTTRTSCDPTNNYAITWSENDAIGIFPREGYQEPFVIPADQVGLSKASFDGGYWALKQGLTYNAYYPFDNANFSSSDCMTRIPVTYLGQSQTGNQCNVGAYDYTYSDWQTADVGSLNFNFHHIGAFLVFNLQLPATTTYTSLTLSANNSVIPTKGTYDLTSSSPAFVSTAKASSITMQLRNFAGSAGENATFYMMMPPCDLSDSELMVTLSTATASCAYSIDPLNIEASHLYNIEGTPIDSKIGGTIDGWSQSTESSTLFFCYEDGKRIPSGTTLTFHNLDPEMYDFEYPQINSGIYIKNNSTSNVSANLACNVTEMTGGELSCCFGTQCRMFTRVGAYNINGVTLAAGSKNDALLHAGSGDLGEYFSISATLTLSDDTGDCSTINVNFIYDETSIVSE